MNGVKPGWKSTEFLVTAAKQVLTFLVLLGVIPAMDLEHVTSAVVAVIMAVGVLASNTVEIVEYIRGRVELKKGGE